MNSTVKKGVYGQSAAYACIKNFIVPSIRPAYIYCVGSIFFNFFFRQYRAALLPGRAPVSGVDHPLDEKIPFAPAWVAIYLDFIGFWVRMLSFLLHTYRRKAYGTVRDFIKSMGDLYAFAAGLYQKNFSTTRRPFYIARPRFFLIHLTDPHLMCIPSLHVMVVIRTYTKFAEIIRSMGDADLFAGEIAMMKRGALAITQAILFVKQHSVNCVAAALYAMTCFDPVLFTPGEAAAFTALLFGETIPAAPRTKLSPADAAEIKAHILNLYRRFLAEKESSKTWDEPLLNFLKSCPQVVH